jgi:signal transduction histidine kinase
MVAGAPGRPRSVFGALRGLTRRIVLMGGLVALLTVAAYALLFSVIVDLRDAAKVSSQSEAVVGSANRLERLVNDLESSVRGYVISGDDAFLKPWNDAQAELPDESADLVRLAAESSPDQARRARQIVGDTESYVRDYSIPLVTAIRAAPRSQRSLTAVAKGEERLVPLRAQFDRFEGVQRGIADSSEGRSDADTRQAMIIAMAGALGALLLLFFFTGYLARAILHPVRRTSRMAGDIAEGDLSVRMPETSNDEIGVLENVFNTMAGSLKASKDELERVIEEQSALRRVATSIAHGVSPIEIFSMVACELGAIQSADFSVINRFDPGGMVTAVGHWAASGAPKEYMPPLGGYWSVEEGSAVAEVLRTGRPARVNHDSATSKIGIWTRQHGVHQIIGCPITVEGRLWGMATVLSMAPDPLPADTEKFMLEFVELLSTAITNAESRSELLASHTRIVAATDETRRRIERNLNDVTQQRLTSLQRELQTAQASLAPEDDRLGEQLMRTAQGVASVLDDLQEITRGLHPATLSKTGLRRALKLLTQRARVPVELNVQIDRRLTDPIEVAVYYTVSEALTNVTKYAHATMVRVDVRAEDRSLSLLVRDNGIGGADPTRGSGLNGLKERVEALGGRLRYTSPPGGGTALLVRIPIETDQPAEA